MSGAEPREWRVLRVETPLQAAALAAEVDHVAREAFREPLSLAEELERPFSRVFVARSADAEGGAAKPAAGYLTAWHVADELHVLQVAARLDLRRRGVGLALMREAIEFARREGVALVLLEVRTSNVAALALYDGLGFERTRVRRGYYADTGEDAVEMALDLRRFADERERGARAAEGAGRGPLR